MRTMRDVIITLITMTYSNITISSRNRLISDMNVRRINVPTRLKCYSNK